MRRYLGRLQKRRMIDASADAGVTVITVCGYDENQSAPKGSDASRGRKASRQRRTTDANENKDAIKKEDTDVSSARALARVASEEISKDFVAHRRALGRPLSELGAKVLASELQDLPNSDAALRTSIANGWTGVFPDKINRSTQSQPKVGDTRTLPTGKVEEYVGGFEGWMAKG